MLRFSLTQLLMGTAFIAILLSFTQTGGCGKRYAMIECLSFSADGERILVTKLNARLTADPEKQAMNDVARTISWANAKSGASEKIIHRDFIPGNFGYRSWYWEVGRTSAIYNPRNNEVTVTTFGGGEDLIQITENESRMDKQSRKVKPGADSLTISSTGRFMAAGSFDTATILDIEDSSRQLGFNDYSYPSSDRSVMAFSQDETRFAMSGGMGLKVTDLETSKPVSTIVPYEYIYSCAMLPDNTLLVCSEYFVQRCNFEGENLATLSNSHRCRVCSANSASNIAAVVEEDVVLYDLVTNSKAKSFPFATVPTALAFSPEGQSLAVGDAEGNLHLIDVKSGNTLWSVSPPGQERWPWTYPFGFLMLWCVVAFVLGKRSSNPKPSAVE